MKKFLRLTALFAALAMIMSFAGCGSAKQTSTANDASKTQDNTFKVGMECAYPPFNWTQSDDSNGAVAIEGGGYAGGYDIEIAKKIAEGLGKKLVIVKTQWDGLVPAVDSGVIDAIIAGMSPTAERKTRIDFTNNYYTSDLVIVVRKDGKYANAKTLDDFAGAKITGQLNTFHYSVIDQIKGVNKQPALEDFPTMTTSLNAGTIDGYISERPGAISAEASNPNLTFISFEKGKGFTASDEDISIAVGLKKGSELKDKINSILSGISEDDRTKIMDNAVKTQPLTSK
ncbi:MAG: transporter substrate-binding domain-containing protein [Bacillota bacterium]|nr:transporter substrate-binding domain-containing protein [Bacillota bacterium]